ncbi:MAG: VCBS repeat-containing protein [Salinivenus sp.]
MMSRALSGLVAALVLLGCAGCGPADRAPPALFDRLDSARTGVTFENTLAESPALNILNYLYYYNGGGVAAGDVNGDGRVDLYFTANEGPNALYLNRGNFRFEEVTDAAGVAGTADWSTGVTMADVNGDGRLDIYVSVVSGIHGLEGHNQLFLNQGPGENGVPRFEERAAAYNLDQRSFGTQAAFFDYDGDGDLDVYLLNSSVHEEQTYGRSSLRKTTSERAGDRLYENVSGSSGDPDAPTFVEVTDEAGIYSGRTGYGLGVAVSDLDRNGCPDLYVANDFHEHDYLYYNNCDGTFTEAIERATRHVSYSSMGVDAADLNNDGRPDLAVLDMLPPDEATQNTTAGADTEEIYEMKRRYGYHHQLDRNTLQLNRGNRRFSEIGLLAGVAATDWSWAPLFADLDNDGRKDLFVTNGIVRRPNDLDFVDYASQPAVAEKMQTIDEQELSIQERLPPGRAPNVAFRNDGDLTFSDSSAAWGLGRTGVSNGAAYADLNDDGALDLVVNNINAPASIYENRADSLREHHFLRVQLQGGPDNTHGVGARVAVHQPGRTQFLEQTPTRGYQSSVPPRLHAGLGTQGVDSLVVTWPSGDTETRTQVPRDTTLTLRRADAAAPESAPSRESEETPLFSVMPADTLGIDFRHEENTSFNDFRREPLLPRRLSTEGPALAVTDVNGDGREDVFLGGAKRQPAALYLQGPGGQFRRSAATDSLWRADRLHEDVDAAFFDANGDDAPDLYVVSAGNEFSAGADALRDRLYRNDGTGRFRRARGALPEDMAVNGGAVAPGDVDGDGDTDLFVGGRSVPRRYGKAPKSVLLENDGTGRFTDVTEERAPELRRVGMVTDAVWADVRGGAAPELVVVGEWMPITVFGRQDGGRLVDHTAAAGLAGTEGWWTAVRATDLTGDGAPDLVAGNFGRNSRLRAGPDTPVELYRGDVNDDGEAEPILTRYNDGTRYPWAGRDRLLERFPSLTEQFPTYESFGAARLEDLFPSAAIEGATVQTARTFASAVATNRGDGSFAVDPLPSRAQFAPVYGVLAGALTGKGRREVMLGGNFHGVRPRQGRYDASYGTLLRRADTSGWAAVPAPKSGLYLRGEVRALRRLRGPDGARYVIVARNNARPQLVALPDAGPARTAARRE